MTHLSSFDLDEHAPTYRGTASSVAIENVVGELYSEAVRLFPTYESVVRSHFCERIRNTYGNDESLNADVQYAFAFARYAFDYVSEADLLKIEAKNRKIGICSHGLTKQTCPCGCFEFDLEPESEPDFEPYFTPD